MATLSLGLIVVLHGDVSVASGASTTSVATSAVKVWVSTVGDDSTCARGNKNRPCKTFNRAYEVAQCGDTVELAAGSYPRQDLWASKTCTDSSYIVFRPAAGASVAVQWIQADVGGSQYVEIRDFKLDRVSIDTGNWRVRNIDGGGFNINGANISMSGNDWGPCESNGAVNCGGAQNLVQYRASNVVIDGDTIHDFTITPGSGAHYECIFANGSTGAVMIRNTRFDNCETYAIYFTGFRPEHQYNGSITIEKNWFGRTCCFGSYPRNSAINLGVDPSAGASPVRNLLIRFNSFAPGQTLVREGGPAGSNIRAVGNIFGTAVGGCLADVTYTSNLVLGGQCSAEDRPGPPYGYVLVDDGLRPDRQRADAIRVAFRTAADGEKLSPIARSLRKARYPKPPGGWNAQAVGRLIANRDYLGGTIGWPPSHPALVSTATWKRAQKALR